jgi:hypothetical protein
MVSSIVPVSRVPAASSQGAKPKLAAPGSSPPVAPPASENQANTRSVDVAGDSRANPMPRTPSLREQVAIAEQITNKKSHYQTEAQLQAYLTSMEVSLPQTAYDRQGFLASIGLNGIRAAGRTDRPVLEAVRAQPGYVPNDDSTGKTIWIQKKFFGLAMSHPNTFMGIAKKLNPVLESKGRSQHKWKQPLISPQKAVPTGIAPQDRYKDALSHLQAQRLRFGPDVHGGIPNIDGPTHPTYGTYAIALSMGFDDAAARRFGLMSEGVDSNTTPYGKTSPNPLHQIDRHFNLDREAQDTRLVYAQDHLKNAIAFAKQSSYDQAEIELGCGLHSLQDLFAHGQISPSVHAVLGQFPDDVDWNPIAFYEATGATAAYLAAYLKAIAPAAGQ